MSGAARWTLPSPLGVLHATWSAHGLTRLWCDDAEAATTVRDAVAILGAEGGDPPPQRLPPAFGGLPHDADVCVETRLRAALTRYLAGAAEPFDLPLAPSGTPFQRRVWDALRAVPHGSTISYAELARRVGSHPRAVGQAVGQNPLWIVVPCHRVVGSDGRLTGYAGGLARKEALLRVEGIAVEGGRVQA